MGNRLATMNMGRKVGGCCVPFRGAGSTSNTMWPGPRPTSVPKSTLIIFFGGGAESPSNTMSTGPRPTSTLIHPALWPQQTWAENCGCLGPGHIVLGTQSPHKDRVPNFQHVYCGQTAGWIKMPLGMEVGLGPGDIVRWEPAPPKKTGHSPPIFGPCLLWQSSFTAQFRRNMT